MTKEKGPEERSFPTIAECDALVVQGRAEKIGNAYRILPSTDPEKIAESKRSWDIFRSEYNKAFEAASAKLRASQRKAFVDLGLRDFRIY